jgi:FkbM family methyltransferase
MLYRAVRRFNLLKAMFGREPFHRLDQRMKTEYHGSSYGGWALLSDSLNEDSVVYSLGIGHDVSFDLSVIHRYQNKVFAYDPTPKSIDWVSVNVREPRFIFQPIAVGPCDGVLDLFEPDRASADQVSASVFKTSEATSSFAVPCQSFKTMLDSNGHVSCDVLKMDVEGSEYAILQQLCTTGTIHQIKQLLVEFHHFLPGLGARQTKLCVENLRNEGFKTCWISRTNHEYLFVRSDVAHRYSDAFSDARPLSQSSIN